MLQTPNEDRTRRLITKAVLTAADDETPVLRPLLGGRIDDTHSPSPLAYSTLIHSSNVGGRSRRHNGNEQDDSDNQGRLLSPSTFTRISETLGALNTVGNFLVNFTRGENNHYHQMHNQANGRPVDHLDAETLGDSGERPMQMIASSSSIDATSVPDAILTLTKNVLGQNMTKTIEPLIKRVGMMTKLDTQEPPAIGHRIDGDEQKRKKHEVDKKKDDSNGNDTKVPALTPGISMNRL